MIIGFLRELKHRAFVAKKKGKRAKNKALTVSFRALDRVIPFAQRDSVYRGTFVEGTPASHRGEPKEVPRQLFLFWTGDNPMNENRVRCMADIQATNPDVPIRLITPDNLNEIVLPGHPLHPAYEYLSLVHRSDYLRAYVMHHHGGAYTDIKEQRTGMAPLFEHFSDPDVWVVGYPEPGVYMTDHTPGRLGRSLRLRFRRLPGQGAFLVRPGTPWTEAWLTEVERRLDHSYDAVRSNPGGVFGSGVLWATNPSYPLRWVEILGEVWHPLAHRYREHIVLEPRLKPSFLAYK